MLFSQIAKKVFKLLGYFYKEICHQKLSKIAQSGHTVLEKGAIEGHRATETEIDETHVLKFWPTSAKFILFSTILFTIQWQIQLKNNSFRLNKSN